MLCPHATRDAMRCFSDSVGLGAGLGGSSSLVSQRHEKVSSPIYGDCARPRRGWRLFYPELHLLESRWREDADELHFAHWPRIHAGMHAVVLRFSSREIWREYCRPMLCRHHRAWQFGRSGKRAGASYALNWSAVIVMTAFFWIPVVCLRWSEHGTSYS